MPDAYAAVLDPPAQAPPGRCFLCGGQDGPVVLEENGYRGRACPCGVVYIDPQPPEGAVDPREDHHPDSSYALPARLRMDWVARFSPAGSLLEVGCGSGHLVAEALARGYRVAALEPNPAAALDVSQRLGIPVEEALVEESEQPDGSYDVVVHVDLLSHFPDPVLALRRMARLVRPGGVLCFEVSAFGGLSPGWYGWLGRVGFPQHRWLYSEAALHALLAKAGLEVAGIRRFAVLPSTAVSTLGNRLLGSRALPARNGTPSGDGRAGRPSAFTTAYSALHYLLRYRLGALLPVVGPAALFVAARPRAQ
jgi:SAM-dependent methyltransferase